MFYSKWSQGRVIRKARCHHSTGVSVVVFLASDVQTVQWKETRAIFHSKAVTRYRESQVIKDARVRFLLFSLLIHASTTLVAGLRAHLIFFVTFQLVLRRPTFEINADFGGINGWPADVSIASYLPTPVSSLVKENRLSHF